VASKGAVIRERYEHACTGYDELYRAEQFEKYLHGLGFVEPRGAVLDAGCGTGLLLEYMVARGLTGDLELYVCLDYSWCMLGIAAWRMKRLCRGFSCAAVLGDVERIPFPPASFDTVYSFTVLDLVDSLRDAVGELLRVSRGPVLVSMMKRLRYKDILLSLGAPVVGVTGKDVILRLDHDNIYRWAFGARGKDQGERRSPRVSEKAGREAWS